MKIRTVLCPVDFKGKTGRELALAKQVCRSFGAKLVVEHNLDPRPPNFLTVTWMWSEEFEGEEEQKLGAARQKLAALVEGLSRDFDCEAKLTRGPIDDVLLMLIKDLPADLLIMGSHGWSTAEHTSLTEKMIRESPVPVLTVGNAEGDPPTLFGSEVPGRPRILATVDDESQADVGVEYAAALVDHLDASLLLLEVFPEGSDTGKAADRMSRAEESMRSLAGQKLGERLESRAVAGHQTEEILREVEASDIDLVVRPVHSGLLPKAKRRQYADLELLHSSRCPVVFVPAKFTL